jgi:hypothetical protein
MFELLSSLMSHHSLTSFAQYIMLWVPLEDLKQKCSQEGATVPLEGLNLKAYRKAAPLTRFHRSGSPRIYRRGKGGTFDTSASWHLAAVYGRLDHSDQWRSDFPQSWNLRG